MSKDELLKLFNNIDEKGKEKKTSTSKAQKKETSSKTKKKETSKKTSKK